MAEAATARRGRAESLRVLGLVLPAWVALGVFLVLPLGIIFLISFARRDASGLIKPIDDVRA